MHYGKYCEGPRLCLVSSRHAPRAIFPVVHERNQCLYWFIVCAVSAEARIAMSACAFLTYVAHPAASLNIKQIYGSVENSYSAALLNKDRRVISP